MSTTSAERVKPTLPVWEPASRYPMYHSSERPPRVVLDGNGNRVGKRLEDGPRFAGRAGSENPFVTAAKQLNDNSVLVAANALQAASKRVDHSSGHRDDTQHDYVELYVVDDDIELSSTYERAVSALAALRGINGEIGVDKAAIDSVELLTRSAVLRLRNRTTAYVDTLNQHVETVAEAIGQPWVIAYNNTYVSGYERRFKDFAYIGLPLAGFQPIQTDEKLRITPLVWNHDQTDITRLPWGYQIDKGNPTFIES